MRHDDTRRPQAWARQTPWAGTRQTTQQAAQQRAQQWAQQRAQQWAQQRIQQWGQPRTEPRIGDAEREAAVGALGEHYVAGRLTKDEFDERSAVAWQARTGSELAPLFADLPALVQQPTSHTGRPARPTAGRRGPRLPLLPLLLVLVGLAMLTDVRLVVVAVGLLWWFGAFRWLARVTSGHHRRQRV